MEPTLRIAEVSGVGGFWLSSALPVCVEPGLLADRRAPGVLVPHNINTDSLGNAAPVPQGRGASDPAAWAPELRPARQAVLGEGLGRIVL